MVNINTEIQAKDGGQKLSLINFIDFTIKEMKYGEIQLVIHDEKVVEIKKTEKFRFLT